MVPSIVFLLVMLYGNLLFVHRLLMAVPSSNASISSLESWQYKVAKLILNTNRNIPKTDLFLDENRQMIIQTDRGFPTLLGLRSYNSSAISWRSSLFVDETGIPGENHQPVASHSKSKSLNVREILDPKDLFKTKQICKCLKEANNIRNAQFTGVRRLGSVGVPLSMGRTWFFPLVVVLPIDPRHQIPVNNLIYFISLLYAYLLLIHIYVMYYNYIVLS